MTLSWGGAGWGVLTEGEDERVEADHAALGELGEQPVRDAADESCVHTNTRRRRVRFIVFWVFVLCCRINGTQFSILIIIVR